MLGALEYFYEEPTTYEAPEPEVVEVTEPTPEPVDVITDAQRQLDEVNKRLDEEETRLLGDKTELQKQYDSEVAAIEARLEKIRETRMSFQ